MWRDRESVTYYSLEAPEESCSLQSPGCNPAAPHSCSLPSLPGERVSHTQSGRGFNKFQILDATSSLVVGPSVPGGL